MTFRSSELKLHEISWISGGHLVVLMAVCYILDYIDACEQHLMLFFFSFWKALLVLNALWKLMIIADDNGSDVFVNRWRLISAVISQTASLFFILSLVSTHLILSLVLSKNKITPTPLSFVYYYGLHIIPVTLKECIMTGFEKKKKKITAEYHTSETYTEYVGIHIFTELLMH